MLHTQHRDSRDIDIFLDDPQVLGFLTPRLWDIPNSPGEYEESSNHLKLNYSCGEIDYIVASFITEDPVETTTINGIELKLETPGEIIAKKLFYRGKTLKVRDIFDIAVVVKSYPQELAIALENQTGPKKDALESLQKLNPKFQKQYLEGLNIRSEWEFLKPDVGQIVKSFLES